MSQDKWYGMNWITKHKRLALYLRGGCTCYICGASAGDEDVILTLDHITPRNEGGDNSHTNLLPCCKACNSSRQDRPINEILPESEIATVIEHLHIDYRPYVEIAREILQQARDFREAVLMAANLVAAL